MPNASKINDTLFTAGQNAKSNPYIQKLLQDEDLRNNAIDALKSARKAYDRASSKGWDKNDLASDKKLRKELHQAINGLKDAREGLIAAPKKSGGGLRKLVLLGLIGVGIVFAVNEDARKKVLDTLFGAEEEFEYNSTTSSTNGSS